MDTTRKHTLNTDNALLFRPWDCQNSLKTAESQTKSSITMVPNAEKCLPMPVVTEALTPFGMPASKYYHSKSANQRSNLISLMGQSAPCFFPTGDKLSHSKHLEYGFKPNLCQLPLPDAANAFNVSTTSGSFFSIPSVFGYNFPANLPNSLFPTNQTHFSNLVANKAFFSAAPTNVSELEKAIEQQQNLLERTPKKQRPKRFQCPHCQVSFSNNGQLKGHIRIHTGELLFALF